MRNTRPHPALSVFIGALVLCAVVGLVLSWRSYGVHVDSTLVVLAALAVVAELATFTYFPGADVATSYPITIATLVIFGPTAAALLGAVIIVFTIAWRQRPAPVKIAFNVSQAVIGDLAAGWTYVLLGGPVLSVNRFVSSAIASQFAQWHQFIVPVIAATVVSVAVNVALVVTVVWLSEGTSPASSLREVGLGVFVSVHLALSLVGLAIALIVVSYTWVGLIVFAFPLLTARQIFQNSARLQHDYPDTVRILVRSIEAKDEYTRGHSERVAGYAVRFCEFLGLRTRETERIHFAALLHDFGKMSVRAEVLNKPARLDDDEYAEMKRHPAAALEIVSKIPDTEELLPVIRHHHERIDGQGYPDGIRGEGIPYASRLLAVCDTYDAMTSSRPYRPALSREEALGELTAVSGSQLDAELAQSFIELLESEGGQE